MPLSSAPLPEPQKTRYQTRSGLVIVRTLQALPYEHATRPLINALDSVPGVLLSSNYEYPGRYNRWDAGFAAPPLALHATGYAFHLEALNARGAMVLKPILRALQNASERFALTNKDAHNIFGTVLNTKGFTDSEEKRTKRPSIFDLIRLIRGLFASSEDSFLGLYGAFGYDLVLQFEEFQTRIPRIEDQRDLALFLPDRLILVDHHSRQAHDIRYNFLIDGVESETLDAAMPEKAWRAGKAPESRDHPAGAYADCVRSVLRHFQRGELFEIVPGQCFRKICTASPARVFQSLSASNPSPFGCLMNLGRGEYLIGASPEMFVRVRGKRVETCPISGTVARGQNALEDAERVRRLLNSSKDEAELTMCSDVDRNDKARICVPGSIRVIGRRQLEFYSRLIHTVDHIEGILREGYDALDAFLTHAWAVTVTGAPKLWAMRFIEKYEKSPRNWYGGAIGHIGFNGDINTGLTIRTIQVRDGMAEIRAGATLLADSDPESEERETELKASALFAALEQATRPSIPQPAFASKKEESKRILLLDHQDSFIHMLGDYIRQAGAEVVTTRPQNCAKWLERFKPSMIVLSPGPGRPADFEMNATLALLEKTGLPVFGVCLGLQGMVEYLGGKLETLDSPWHGRPDTVRLFEDALFSGLPDAITVGRYHSLIAAPMRLPESLRVIACGSQADGQDTIMGIAHRSRAWKAVQFHPESVMSATNEHGLKLIRNLVALGASPH